MKLRIGQGWDIHRLVSDRKLMLGGLEVPSSKGEEAHSDGDVLLHAVIDALLGALALGDIGSYFPPSDPQWKDADSSLLLSKVLEMVSEKKFHLVNLDSTLILEQPRLKEWKLPIRQSLSTLLKIPLDAVSLKAKTAEKLGPVGAGDAVEAQAVVLLEELL